MTNNEPKRRLEGTSDHCHAFPALNDVQTNSMTHDSGKQCFRPLYQIPADQSELTEDEIRKKGFQRGFAAGRQDAVQHLQQEILPHVKDFTAELLQLREFLFHTEKESSQNIPRMMQSIAEKILCDSFNFATEDLNTLKEEIFQYFNMCYQMVLKMNPADIDLITQFFGSAPPGWKDDLIVQICSDDGIQKGGLQNETQSPPSLPTNAMSNIIQNMLAKASTK
jgi:hypothetical protein